MPTTKPLRKTFHLLIAYVARSAKSVLAIVILSVCLSVRLSVRLSRPGTDSSPGEIETALRSLEVDYDNLLMKLN